MCLDHTPKYGDGFRTLSVFRAQSTDGISTEYGRNLKYMVRKQYGDGIIWKFGYGYGYGYGLKKNGSTGTEFRLEIDGKYINVLKYSTIFEV